MGVGSAVMASNPKTSRRNPSDLAGACACGKFVVSKAGEAYDALLRSRARLELMTSPSEAARPT